MARSLQNAIETIAADSPTIEQPTAFIAWAEVVCDVLCVVYPGTDYEALTEELYNSCKDYQGYYEPDDDEDY